ncbi:Gfo/Idh/MocA family oxidoreductase [Brachybacterium halotolerans subsp. kimchii]|uniref:Gfo/Idh/MocA family protein n=1 Tax=Brachybacterium halotolerans TaxID=2795215 RepID=UPI001E420769|nr:Gfo/Idh/MocA family oxidoreductase [Brachybacterium halotolerans]UEJ81609.1 Gfo/Idh/MocA family oxidoreductase [Brachybacterium halotolerans subsp. kimchii]
MFSVGIIGTGAISDAHINAYLELAEEFPDLRIVALADLDLPGPTAKREAFGLENARVYDDVAAMLEAEDLDLVSVTTPPSAHAPLAIQVLEAGVNAVVEKPMATSLEECDAMLAAQRASGKILSTIAQNRFRDEMARLKAVLDSGKIGPLSHARIASEWWRGHSYYDLWWRGTWASEGGGPTLNHAIHHIDIALWLLGRPLAVSAMMTNAQHDNAEVEDLSTAILQYERSLAELTSSVVHHGQKQEISLQGARARVSQPWEPAAEVARPNGFPEQGGDVETVAELEEFAASLPPLPRTGHPAQLADVVAAVREGREPLVTGQDGRNAVELVTAVYESAIERRVVDLPISPEDPYYRSGTLVERAPHFHEKTGSVATQDGYMPVGLPDAAQA